MARDFDEPTTAKRPVRWIIPAVLLLVVLALTSWLVWQFLDDDESAGPNVGVTIDDLADDDLSDIYLGEQVVISGEVASVFVPGRAYWLGDIDLGGDAVMLITQETLDLEEGVVVQAQGTVVELDRTALAEALGIGEGTFGPYEEENVVLVVPRVSSSVYSAVVGTDR